MQHLLHPGGELGPVFRHGLGGPFLHLAGIGLDGGEAVADVLRQLGALHGPHGIISGQGFFQYGAQIGADTLQILVRLGDGEHVREAGQRLRPHLEVFTAADLRQLPQGGDISGGQFPVDGDFRHIGGGGVHGDEHIHLAPGNGLLDTALDGVLGEGVHSGHLHRAVQIPVIDGADLHRDVPLVQHLAGPAIAGHTFDHVDSPSLVDLSTAEEISAAVAEGI